MSNIKIVSAIPENADDIITIQKSTWLDNYPNQLLEITKEDIEKKLNEISRQDEIEQMKRKIENDISAHIWVAKDNNKVVGYIGVAKSDSKNILGGLHIISDYQNRGIGKRLMKKGLEWLGNNKKVSLHVVAYNEKAINFYKSFGFVENGATRDYQVTFDNGNILPQIEMIKS